MNDNQPEVLFRPAPRFSERQLLLIFAFSLLLVSVLLVLVRVSGNRGEPAPPAQEAEILTPEEAAEKYGYKIQHKQVSDTTGRTVVTRDRQGLDLWGSAGPPEQEGFITVAWGQVGNIEEVPGSEDLVVTITNPVEREELARVRIDRTKPNLPGGTNLEIFTTPVFLDSLAGPFEPKRIGYAGQWSAEEFKRILREGDFLGVGVALTWEDPVAKTGKLVPSRDELGNLFVTGITVRRVGGKEAVLNDLSN